MAPLAPHYPRCSLSLLSSPWRPLPHQTRKPILYSFFTPLLAAGPLASHPACSVLNLWPVHVSLRAVGQSWSGEEGSCPWRGAEGTLTAALAKGSHPGTAECDFKPRQQRELVTVFSKIRAVINTTRGKGSECSVCPHKRGKYLVVSVGGTICKDSGFAHQKCSLSLCRPRRNKIKQIMSL